MANAISVDRKKKEAQGHCCPPRSCGRARPYCQPENPDYEIYFDLEQQAFEAEIRSRLSRYAD